MNTEPSRVRVLILLCWMTLCGTAWGATSLWLVAEPERPSPAPRVGRDIPLPVASISSEPKEAPIALPTAPRVRGRPFRDDCSGYLAARYAQLGWHIEGSVRDLHRLAERRGLLHRRLIPQVGDIAFYDNTWDRNGNGRWDDTLTHGAIVEEIDEQGRIRLSHWGSGGEAVLFMDLSNPRLHHDEAGEVLNSTLRAGGAGGERSLTGALWVGFGSLWMLDRHDRIFPRPDAPPPPAPPGG